MTDGIIQKVISADFLSELYTYVHLNGLPEDLSPNEYVADMIRQKLIKEIDKASRLYGCTCWIETAALIGETKE